MSPTLGEIHHRSANVPQNTPQLTASANHALPELLSYIDGEIVTPAIDRQSMLRNPNDRQPLQAQLACSPEQLETALVAADTAYNTGTWENTAPVERANVLERIADELESPEVCERIAYADAITTGAVIHVTRKMAALAPYVFRGAAQFIREGNLEQRLPGKLGDVEYFRRPWGPALLVSPWNGPTAIGSHKIASALAAGAPCIIKPSEWAPHSALVMADIIHRADLPRGTFQLTCGNRHSGGQLVDDPRIKSISFTGGTAGGRAIARACAENFRPTQLELGGNNPLVVFSDADLDLAATGICYGLSNLNAQWCRALGRVLVHHSVKEQLLQRVETQLASIQLGHSLDETSDMGPLIHQAQYDSVRAEIQRLRDAGGELIQSTPMPDLPGYFVAPTLVDGCQTSDTEEEIFGPVACVHTFNSDDEALQLANATEYGLAAYVYSGNEERAFNFGRQLRTGGVKINGYSLLSLSSAPRGAWGISGLGEEGTADSIEFFTGARTLGLSPQDKIRGR
ncbi:MAG: aldehyde dehydrogenase family protein [Halioglobus sp.]